MTMESFENAIAVDMAIGGSTNTVLHLPAIAHEAGIDLPLQKFDEISRKAAYICKMSPGGTYHMQDLNEAGGISAVMKELTKLGIIHTEAKTVTGTIGDRIAHADIERPDVIHSVDNAYMNRGGIAILSATWLPTERSSRKAPSNRTCWYIKAQPSATTRKKKLSKRLSAATSRKETSWSSATKGRRAVQGCGKCSTDGSHYGHGPESGLDYGRPVQRSQPGRVHRHISPEAMEGGPIALIEDGDMISIDIPNRKLELLVSDEELAARKAAWKQPEPKVKTGYLSRYARLVTSANTGAVLK